MFSKSFAVYDYRSWTAVFRITFFMFLILAFFAGSAKTVDCEYDSLDDAGNQIIETDEEISEQEPGSPLPGLATTKSIISEDYFKNNWKDWPEYTVFNRYELNVGNCTWYAYGRMMQLGYSKYSLDVIHGNPEDWANNVKNSSNPRGKKVVSEPEVHSIACWSRSSSGLNHAAVVEKVNYDSDGKVKSITISESNWFGPFY